ncbi:hypothetical protein VPH35_041673 [Triticum aestivum]|uniref:DUF6598 domain-containing protein n=1 Tax=Aegilops tauschii TaxID=37682 RepID=M8B1T1_AEGTA
MGKGKHQSQSQSLVNEIISVERERRDLLGSLTPAFSLWNEIDSPTTWTIATKEPATSSRDEDDENHQLTDYFNLMLQDTEDPGHRMLSMLHLLNKSNDPICSYKATELCNTAAKLNQRCYTHDKSERFSDDIELEPELGQINLPSLFRKYSRFPDNYENTLAQFVMEEDEENKYEDVKVEEEEEQEKDVSTIMEYLKERMDVEQEFFGYDRTYWEDVWGSRIGRCGGFMDTRAKEEDCSLCLTGPSRVIVALQPVDFEVQLQTVEGAEFQDTTLISLGHRLEDDPSSGSDGSAGRQFICRMQKKKLKRRTTAFASTQAIFLASTGKRAKRAGNRSWRCPYRPVVLLDRRGEGLHRGSENYLQLSRKVVSVESQGTLRVAIEAYGKSHSWIARKGHIDFPVQQCQTSTRDCSVGDATVEVVVAWSLLVKEKVDLLVDCPAIYVAM